ncbi:MAG: guanitoxin biosynthesis pre-guanitoxin forming N-methyltransferase GntF [Blastocatellales bacterium]|nr:guanitoxin biosynthesis pre-guanitoxin forming N-methyltransferase GntF [Nitrosomonas nitrosa]
MFDQPTIYNRLWDPQEYLQEYYSQNFIPDDEEAIQQRLVAFLKSSGRTFRRAIDVGCGPTVHLHTALAPYVDELHLADYLPENLTVVERWLKDEPDAHNWDLKIKHVLQLENGGPVSQSMLEDRKALMRQKATKLKTCDLRCTSPLGRKEVYDLVISAYCVDATTDSKHEWHKIVDNLLSLCSANGAVFIVSALKSRSYLIGGKVFPFAFLDEKDIEQALIAAGFNLNHISLETIPIHTWAELAFNNIAIAIAAKDL